MRKQLLLSTAALGFLLTSGKGGDGQATDEKNRPAPAAEHKQPKAGDHAQESRQPGRERDRDTNRAKPGRESGKNNAETKQENSGKKKPTAET